MALPADGSRPAPGRRFVAAAAAILLLSIALKLVLVSHIDGRVYGDVQRAINFGYAVDEGRAHITTHSDQTKTFVGPLIWYRLFLAGGAGAVKAVNFVFFVLLFAAQLALARRLTNDETALVTAVLFAFYVGTVRNVVAGEPDDMVAALCVAAAILAWVTRGRGDLAGGLAGVGFLFKFWAGIFFLGFAAYLAHQRRWKELAIAGAASVVPFALINLVDRGQSLRGLLYSAGIQQGYSSWNIVAFKLVSTGILAGTLIAAYQQWRRPTEAGKLLLPLALAYPIYMVLMRDAHAASFVGMLWIVFAGPLLALWVLQLRPPGVSRKVVAGAVLAVYVVVATGLAAYRLHHDTQDLYLTRGDSYESREPFRLMRP